MFKIVVCFKVTYDYDELVSSDWHALEGLTIPDPDYVKRMLGCFDEAALENALLLKEKMEASGCEVCVKAVTVNPGYSEHIISRLKAVGIDEIACIDTGINMDFEPEQTAQLLADYIVDQDADLVLCGMQTAPGNSGKVPVLISEQLDYVFKNAVTKLTYEQPLKVVCEYREGYIEYILDGKTVCALGNTEKTYLRIPTLREKMRVKGYQPTSFNVNVTPTFNNYEFSCSNGERECKIMDDPEAYAVEVKVLLDAERDL